MIHAIWKDHGDIEGALVSVKHIMISEMSALSPDIKANILSISMLLENTLEQGFVFI